MKDALIVFAKAPVAGCVKTRLVPPLTPEEAAVLYEAFLADALAQYATLGADVRLYVSPPAEALPDGLVPADVEVFAQTGDGLGARMKQAFRETFAAGCERAVIIGTDHPTLPLAFIEQAFEALEPAPAVSIGPSADGGYYLLGMSALFAQLFDGMAYSHGRVFEQTLARIEATPACLTVLPEWYDVDTPEALHRLVRDLCDPSVEALHTRRAVAALQETHPALAI